MSDDELKQVRYYFKHALITKTRFLNKFRSSIVNIQFRLLHDQLFVQRMLYRHLQQLCVKKTT